MWRALPAFLLIAEVLALSYSFDIQKIATHQGWWGASRELGTWLPLGLLAFLGVCTALGKPILEAFQAQSISRQLRWSALTLAVAALIYALSATLHGSATPAEPSVAVAWFMLLLTWLTCGLHSMLPLQSVLGTALLFPRSALAGLAVGGLAYGAGRFFIENWDSLAPVTLVGVGAVLFVLGHKPWRGDDLVVGLGDFSVRIAPECSGVEGMGLLSVFLLGFIAIFHRRIQVAKALILVPLALVASGFFNSLRIALLLIIGARGHPDVALMGFHTKAGWLFFSLIALGAVMLLGSKHFARPYRVAPELGGEVFKKETALLGTSSPTPYLLPLLILTLAGLFAESFRTEVDHFYFVRIVAGLVAFLLLTPPRDKLRLSGAACLWGALFGVLGFLMWWSFVPEDETRSLIIRSAYDELAPTRRTLELGARLMGSVLVVPLVEELAFRGYLMRRVKSMHFEGVDFKDCSMLALLASSIIFGVLHFSAWLPATLCGLLFGAAAIKTGRLSAAIVAHAVTNACIAVAVLLGRFDFI